MPISRTIAAATLLGASVMLCACSVEAPSVLNFLSNICASAIRADSPDEAAFVAETVTTMTKMMADMDVRPSGNVDADFVDMMVAHHRGAIGMAATELRYGRNERLKRIAQEIIITQQQEIIAMQALLRASKQPHAVDRLTLAD